MRCASLAGYHGSTSRPCLSSRYCRPRSRARNTVLTRPGGCACRQRRVTAAHRARACSMVIPGPPRHHLDQCQPAVVNARSAIVRDRAVVLIGAREPSRGGLSLENRLLDAITVTVRAGRARPTTAGRGEVARPNRALIRSGLALTSYLACRNVAPPQGALQQREKLANHSSPTHVPARACGSRLARCPGHGHREGPPSVLPCTAKAGEESAIAVVHVENDGRCCP